ncbi:hypothetical protein [Helicobacter fennelliae]|uniref:hypothetical protein n=1 Tax=Helicobacter fennelliae TaxID=215 RepID=UPI001F1C8C98|nr:hypothetical protein [Helicobacter fennelliae]
MNIGNTSCIELWDIDKARGDKGDSNQQIKRESSQTYTRSVESGGQNDTGDLRNNGFAQEDSTKENIFKDARKDYEKFTPKENITNEQSFGENGRFESRDGQNGEYLKRSGSNARDDRQNKQGVERSERKSQNTQSRTNERTNEEIKEFSNISSRNKPVITESQTITRAREYQQRVSTLLQSQLTNGIIQRTLESLRSAKREQNPRESTNRLEKKATQNYHTNPRFNGGEARSAFGNERQGGELESAGGFQQLDRNNIQPNGEQQQGKRDLLQSQKRFQLPRPIEDHIETIMQETSEEIMRQLEMMDNNQTNFQVLKLSKQANKIAKQILQVKMNLPISFQILKTLAIYLAMKQSKKNLIKQIFHKNLEEQMMLFLIQIHQNLKMQIMTIEQNEQIGRKWEVLTNKSNKIWSLIYLLMIESKLYTNKILINKKSCKMHKAEELENLKQKIETMDQENLKLIVDSYKNREAIDLEYLLNTNF